MFGSTDPRVSFPRVARLELVPNRQNQYDVFGRKPTVLRDITVTAARKDELAPPLFGRPPEQRMVGKQLKRLADADDLFARPLGVLDRNEVEQPLEISERSLGYFDRRHARAFGRRAFTPEARAAK